MFRRNSARSSKKSNFHLIILLHPNRLIEIHQENHHHTRKNINVSFFRLVFFLPFSILSFLFPSTFLSLSFLFLLPHCDDVIKILPWARHHNAASIREEDRVSVHRTSNRTTSEDLHHHLQEKGTESQKRREKEMDHPPFFFRFSSFFFSLAIPFISSLFVFSFRLSSSPYFRFHGEIAWWILSRY